MTTTTQRMMAGVGAPPLRALRGVLRFFRQMAQRPLAFTGMIIVFIFLFLAVIGPDVAPYRYDQIIRGTDIGLDDRRAQKGLPPSETFIMGTDQRGRDIFSRMLWGARDTIGLPLVATLIAVIIGNAVGLAVGYLGGWVDEVVSRAMDSLLSIPALVLALVMISTIVPVMSESDIPLVQSIGATSISLTIVIVLLYVPIVTRVVRSATLNVRTSGYIEAAKLRGETTLYIMFREIFPSVLPALVVEASLRLSYAIFLVASLGFLGLGVQPPTPEWGRMVLDARPRFTTEPWEMWFPVLGIAILITSVNLMSDGLRRIFRNDQERE
jgi:peptide/nickel transport system permease protein